MFALGSFLVRTWVVTVLCLTWYILVCCVSKVWFRNSASRVIAQGCAYCQINQHPHRANGNSVRQWVMVHGHRVCGKILKMFPYYVDGIRLRLFRVSQFSMLSIVFYYK